MPSASYNKADIPRELQRLIDHTDRGIEQLYQLAGHNARVTDRLIRKLPQKPSETAQQRAQRDSYYYYDPAHTYGVNDNREATRQSTTDASRQPPQAGWKEAAQQRRPPTHSRRNRGDADLYGRPPHHATFSPITEAQSGSGGEEEEEDEEAVECDDVRNTAAVRQGWRDAAMGSGAYSSASPSLHRPRLPTARSSPPSPSTFSTPHRGHRDTDESPASPPRSLEKPPYRQQRDLPSPSSFLSTSLPNGHTSSVLLPPWRQRQHDSGVSGDGPEGLQGKDVSARHASAKTKRAAAGHTSAMSENVSDGSGAYRAHVAAQQFTQRPDESGSSSSSTARQRRRRHRSLSFTEREENVAVPFGEASPRLDMSRSRSLHETSATVSAGMLSRFGKRWGAVFEGMLTETQGLPSTSSSPPPPPPPPSSSIPASSGVPLRDAAVQHTARRADGTLNGRRTISTESPSAGEEDEDEDADDERKDSRAAALTSATVHSAAAAIAMRHRAPTSSPTSAVPSANVSGHLVLSAGAAPPPPSAPHVSSTADARLVEQLRAELRAKEEATLQLRMDHAREVAELRQNFALEKTTAAQHTAAELATTHSIQQQQLTAALQTEKERVAEAEEQLRLTRREAAQRRLDLDDAAHALEALQRKHAALVSTQQELTAQVTQWRTQAEKSAAASRQLEAQEKVWRAKEADWQAREGQYQQRVQAAEERLCEQEASAHAVLAQVEAEFTQTSQSYQDLLAEATKRMSYLEKSHRKYKLLKEAHALLRTENAQLADAVTHAAQRHESEMQSLNAEVQELRQQLHQRDSASQAASMSYQETLQDYKRRLELQESSAAEHVKTLQQHLDTSNHTIALLRTQLEGVKQELLEEQGRSQQQQMSAAQAELEAKEALADQQRAAAAYKVRTEEALALLRRQLREKDTKMQALAAGAAEPVQRLRQQLDDERGRRARLEEQLKLYKRKAKEAEEHAAAEMRREQLRTALLLTPVTPAGSSSSTAAPRRPRSATATASADRRSGGSLHHHNPSPPAVMVMGTTSTAATAAMRTNAHAGNDARDRARRMSLDVPANSDAHRHRGAEERTPALPMPPVKATLTTRTPAEAPAAPAAPAAAVAGTETGATRSPDATVQSLSGISPSSPYTSTLLGDGELEKVTAAADAAVADPHDGPISSHASVMSDEKSEEDKGEDEDTDREARALPWYAKKRRQPAPADGEERCVPDDVLTAPSASEDEREEKHVIVASEADASFMDAGMQEHEQRMKTFHSSALEVMRRFAGSRKEALARCADIVKQTAAEQRRSAQGRHAAGTEAHKARNDPASTTDASNSEDDTD